MGSRVDPPSTRVRVATPRDAGPLAAFAARTFREAARAKAFYAKCGYLKIGTQPFTLGRDKQTDLVLVRSLR